MKKLISIIAPMYNEEALVKEYCETTLRELSKLSDEYLLEILLVNDGSKDNTLANMHEMQMKHPDEISIINLSRNFGLEGGISAGLKKAKGDIVIVMDADLQDPPHIILEMVKKYEQGADVVVATRQTRNTDSFFKKSTAGLFYKVLNSFSGKLTLENNAANFRLLSRKAVNKLLDLPEVNGVFRVIVPYIGMKTEVVYYDRDKRFAGKTKYNLKSMLKYALDSLTGISIEPLRKTILTVFISGIFVLASLIGLMLSSGLWRIGFSIILVISILFCMMFICLSIMSEYLAQIMIEVKRRPTSIIYEYTSCKNVERIEENEIC